MHLSNQTSVRLECFLVAFTLSFFEMGWLSDPPKTDDVTKCKWCNPSIAPANVNLIKVLKRPVGYAGLLRKKRRVTGLETCLKLLKT